MLEKKVRKAILEAKENKEKLLIEEGLVKSRIMMIVESEDNIKNFDSLSTKKKEKIAYKLVEEINYLQDNGILNEQLGDFLGKIFGSSFSGILQTIAEPLVNSILSGLGLSGFFKDTLVSLITTKPGELAKALKDCKALTKLIAESLSEAVAMMIMREKGFEGQGYTFLRNALGGAVKNTAFVQSLESNLSGIVCEAFGKMNDKASGVYGKLKKDVAGGLTTAATSLQPK